MSRVFLSFFLEKLETAPPRAGVVRAAFPLRARFGLVRFGLVRFVLVRFVLVRFGLVRFGLVRFGLVRFLSDPRSAASPGPAPASSEKYSFSDVRKIQIFS